MTLPSILSKLEALEREATAPEWHEGKVEFKDGGSEYVVLSTRQDGSEARTNLMLVEGLRNAAPTLLALAGLAVEMREEMRHRTLDGGWIKLIARFDALAQKEEADGEK